MDEECRCCICQEIVIPEDDETLVDSDGRFYCDLHHRFCKEQEGNNA